MSAPTVERVEMIGIVKRFPGVLANDRVDLEVQRGEILALLGENGAGKSTLMKILYGMQPADEGEIRLNGQPLHLRSPSDAIRHGIGMIHQHFMLVPSLTVAENVALGLPSGRGGRLDLTPIMRGIQALSERYNLKVDPRAYVWQLSVGEQQRVEIIKALYRNAGVLIMDEPTAVLTPQEVDDLFKILRQMTADGHAIIFISHKLHEVLAISDRIMVLRDGRAVGSLPTTQATREILARLMVGREVSLRVAHEAMEVGQVRLRVEQLNALNARRLPALRDVSLEVRGGEILGVAGVSGNGQRELAEVIAGLRPLTSGKVYLDEADLTQASVAERIAAGFSYIPEERMRDGAIKTFSVAENAILQTHTRPPIAQRGMINFRAVRQMTGDLITRFNVKTPSQSTPLRNLSGGNIQKLILARELSRNPHVLLAAQPTRGVDIGATMYIHRVLLDQRAHGTAILLISEDLEEILALSDRIAVIYEGQIMGILPRAEATAEKLGLLMAGSL
ncbi:MAG: ABC transporter ATP-binding protein [Chloroflexi bacterium CFX4]|nr:ABC transporter ATP-binding protein [Chloroflexi bacterium CFX4]MDL1923522.1 ABC transporter ATP-binding protein [Chloroflexi bacterium CFX3]